SSVSILMKPPDTGLATGMAGCQETSPCFYFIFPTRVTDNALFLVVRFDFYCRSKRWGCQG
ncbi:MAG: hypothetical protein PVH49_13975, partial [Syntrophobacterales bacterium]